MPDTPSSNLTISRASKCACRSPTCCDWGSRRFGAEASLLAFPQLFEALRSGKFDGQENPDRNNTRREVRPGAEIPVPERPFLRSGGVHHVAGCVRGSLCGGQGNFRRGRQAGGKASRSSAAQAEAEGVAALQQAGMTVQARSTAPAFIAAMAGIIPGIREALRSRVDRADQAGSELTRACQQELNRP